MKLAEGNSGSMEKSNLVCMRLHLKRSCQGSESGGLERRLAQLWYQRCIIGGKNNMRSVQVNYEDELLSMNFAGYT